MVPSYLSGALDGRVAAGVDEAAAVAVAVAAAAAVAVAVAVAVPAAAAVAAVVGKGVDAWLVQNHSVTTGRKIPVLLMRTRMKLMTGTPVVWDAKRGPNLGHQRALLVSASRWCRDSKNYCFRAA